MENNNKHWIKQMQGTEKKSFKGEATEAVQNKTSFAITEWCINKQTKNINLKKIIVIIKYKDIPNMMGCHTALD